MQQKLHSRKYVLTGKLRVGKDFIASACEGTILGFADPMYEVGKNLFGDVPKEAMREFYQRLGDWGKGTVDKDTPITMERACFVLLMRRLGGDLCPTIPVDWASFGRNTNIWLESILGRAFQESGEAFATNEEEADFVPVKDLFVTNARFRPEIAEMTKSGFDHFHVMCSEPTYIERLRAVGIVLGDQRLKHVTEMLANELDREVYGMLRLHPTGPKLKVIWSDDRPSPSDRLFTIEQFKDYVRTNASRKELRIEPSESPVHVEPVVDEKGTGKPGPRVSRKGPATRARK